MPNYSNNYNLYKWNKSDEKLTTITESANNMDKIDTVLKNQDDRIDNIVSNAGNSNTEIVDARGTFSVLKDRLTNVDLSLAEIEQQKADTSYVDAKAASLASGGPKGVYATISDLQSAFPTGNSNIYLVTADGKWYYWNGSAWTAGGVYQATALANGAVTPQKSSFFNAVNVYNPATVTNGYYATGATFTALSTACYSDKIPVKQGDIISVYNFPNTTFGTNVGAIYDSSDNALIGIVGTNKSAESITINQANAAYVRVNCTIVGSPKLMVALNQTITKFVPYGENSILETVKMKQNEYIQIMNGTLTVLEPNSTHTLYPDTSLISTVQQINSLNTVKASIASNGYVGIKKVLDSWAINTNKIKIKLKVKIIAATYPVTVTPFFIGYPNTTFDSGTGTGSGGNTTNVSVADSNVIEIEQTIPFDAKVSIKGILAGLQVVSGTCDCYINQLVLDFDYINDKNPLYGKKVVANGDSIMYGAGSVGGFVKIIAERNGMAYQNVGVSGATVIYGSKYSDGITNRWWICDTIANMDADADFVLLEGGINDYFNGLPMGTITADFNAAIDNTTFYGALESICRQALQRFISGKIIYIINHNVNVIASTDNGTGSGRTFEVYRQAIIDVCKKYSIPVVDLYRDSNFITFYTSIKSAYTNTSDGVHPNANGYKKYYVPHIEDKMKELSYYLV